MDNGDRVHIPADLNTEDPFLSWGPIKLSIRKLATLLGSVFCWIGASRYVAQPLLGLSGAFAMFATAWIPALGVVFTFVTIRGRPIDVWLGDKISFIMTPRTFVLKEQREGWKAQLEADPYTDADVEVMLNQLERAQVIGEMPHSTSQR